MVLRFFIVQTGRKRASGKGVQVARNVEPVSFGFHSQWFILGTLKKASAAAFQGTGSDPL
jgi:hypothetical protein